VSAAQGVVQAVLTAHNYAGEKQRIHHHFLKGTIVCGRCGAHAARKSYDLPYLPVDRVAELVAQAYAHVRLTADEVEELRAHLLRELEHEQQDGAKETNVTKPTCQVSGNAAESLISPPKAPCLRI
jgi:site-specific DNA recombinase